MTKNNTPITVTSSALQEIKAYMERNPGSYTFKDYVDRINQSSLLVEAINDYQSAGKSIALTSNSGELIYNAFDRSLTVPTNSLLSPTFFVRGLAHEIYGHDGTRELIKLVLDPTNSLYAGKNQSQVRELVMQGCFAAEFLGFLGEYRVGIQAGFAPTGYPGLKDDIENALSTVQQFLPSNSDSRAVDLAAAQFIATKAQASDAGHAQQCVAWANYVAGSASSTSSPPARMIFGYDLFDGDSSIVGEHLGSNVNSRISADGSRRVAIAFGDASKLEANLGADGGILEQVITTPVDADKFAVQRYDRNGSPISQTIIEYFYDEHGISRIETVTTASGTVRNTYNADGTLFRSEPAQSSASTNPTTPTTTTILSDLTGLASGLRTGNGLTVVASGASLLNNAAALTGNTLPAGVAGVGSIARGALSIINLGNALNSNDALTQVTGTLSAVSYFNTLLPQTAASTSLSSFLNGSAEGLIGGGTGVLPVLGLVNAIRAEDPIGMAMGLGTVLNGSAFLGTPVGMVLVGAQLLQALFADDVPDAWGTANVTFGPGITNLTPTVNATGDSFGPDRVRAVLEKNLALLKQSATSFNSSAASNTDNGVLQLGIIPQRISSITWRANEFQDQGYAVVEVDRLTGQQRNPTLRFDDQGRMFNLAPEAITPQLRDLLGGAGSTVNGTTFTQLDAYLYNAAIERRALAPRWEVDTARAQTNRGDPDAGLSVEERAAKHGLGNAGGVAGSFRVIGLDLDRDGRISTSTAAQNSTASRQITFDWDASGFQKTVGWVGANDGFLVLDEDVNRVAGNGAEMFNNPLVAEAGRGLRLLEAYDADGDGIKSRECPLRARLRIKSGSSPHGICPMRYERCSKKSGALHANERASSNQIDQDAANEALWEQAA